MMNNKNADLRREFLFRESDEERYVPPPEAEGVKKFTEFPLYFNTDLYYFDPIKGRPMKRRRPKRKYKPGEREKVDHSIPSKNAMMIRSVRALS